MLSIGCCSSRALHCATLSLRTSRSNFEGGRSCRSGCTTERLCGRRSLPHADQPSLRLCTARCRVSAHNPLMPQNLSRECCSFSQVGRPRHELGDATEPGLLCNASPDIWCVYTSGACSLQTKDYHMVRANDSGGLVGRPRHRVVLRYSGQVGRWKVAFYVL
jgi:hypothetical protein